MGATTIGLPYGQIRDGIRCSRASFVWLDLSGKAEDLMAGRQQTDFLPPLPGTATEQRRVKVGQGFPAFDRS